MCCSDTLLQHLSDDLAVWLKQTVRREGTSRQVYNDPESDVK